MKKQVTSTKLKLVSSQDLYYGFEDFNKDRKHRVEVFANSCEEALEKCKKINPNVTEAFYVVEFG